jgi:hypothetical protein
MEKTDSWELNEFYKIVVNITLGAIRNQKKSLLIFPI